MDAEHAIFRYFSTIQNDPSDPPTEPSRVAAPTVSAPSRDGQSGQIHPPSPRPETLW